MARCPPPPQLLRNAPPPSTGIQIIWRDLNWEMLRVKIPPPPGRGGGRSRLRILSLPACRRALLALLHCVLRDGESVISLFL